MDACERRARELLDAEIAGEPRDTYYAAVAVISRLLRPQPGWRPVPIEPNWDMRNEGREFLIDGIEKDPERLAYFLWKTMVNEAPVPDGAHGGHVETLPAFRPPEGYVLVPVEPTEAMLRAHASCGRDAFAVDEYAAMLAARPEVP